MCSCVSSDIQGTNIEKAMDSKWMELHVDFLADRPQNNGQPSSLGHRYTLEKKKAAGGGEEELLSRIPGPTLGAQTLGPGFRSKLQHLLPV